MTMTYHDLNALVLVLNEHCPESEFYVGRISRVDMEPVYWLMDLNRPKTEVGLTDTMPAQDMYRYLSGMLKGITLK